MTVARIILGVWALAGVGSASAQGPAPVAVEARFSNERAVATWSGEWRDASRDRTVPVKIYYPEDGGGPNPVIVFSHGLGGSRDGYNYLGEYWAAHGYVSVHLQHPGSDSAVWQGQARPLQEMARAAADVNNLINRPLDVRFALDRLTALNDDVAWVLRGRLDLLRIGVAGHSFGAYTTLAVAGQTFRAAAGRSLADPRVKAAVAMSAPVPGGAMGVDRGYGGIEIPVFHLTGTRDSDPLGTSDPKLRRVPYDQTQRTPAYLLTLKDGDHRVFSGQRRRGDGSNDPLFWRLIQESTTAFWDATLRQDVEARQWLEGGGFAERLGSAGAFEQKRP